MQFLVNENKANLVFHNAPTLQVVTYQLAGRTIRLESFDYGLLMGWAKEGQDIRARVFIDDTPLPPFHGLVWDRYRPDWLPKSISVKQWNDTLSQQFKQLNLG